MRAQAMPGENPDTLRTPAEVARTLLPLIGPDTTFTGRLYQAKHDRWVDYALPGARLEPRTRVRDWRRLCGNPIVSAQLTERPGEDFHETDNRACRSGACGHHARRRGAGHH